MQIVLVLERFINQNIFFIILKVVMMVKDILSEVDGDDIFLLANNKKVSSIKELYVLLQRLDDKIFYFHVNEEKNDFYNWVRDVYQDKKLADDLLWCTNKESMIFCLKSRIEEAERASLFNLLPSIEVQNTKSKKQQTSTPLNTMIDIDQLRKKSEEKLVKQQKLSKFSNIKERFNKLQAKKIRKESSVDDTLQKIRGVYGL
ncbi:MAG: hypothetical protein QT09_C0006G0033 [archaeon GW2011_AR18]|nr:MAG: hypothetical protein QT09_C0006G0033 [archaeon GW2011_AR18]